jgi:hypothetical protein
MGRAQRTEKGVTMGKATRNETGQAPTRPVPHYYLMAIAAARAGIIGQAARDAPCDTPRGGGTRRLIRRPVVSMAEGSCPPGFEWGSVLA